MVPPGHAVTVEHSEKIIKSKRVEINKRKDNKRESFVGLKISFKIIDNIEFIWNISLIKL